MGNLQNLMDYCKHIDVDIFEGCTVPEPLERDQVINNIMLRCGLLTPVYSEPATFKMMTKMWFQSNQWNFEHLIKIMLAEYSPIENVYEQDHWIEGHSGTDKTEHSGSDTLTHGETHELSGSDTLTHGETHELSGTDTLTHGETHELSGKDTVSDTGTNEHQVSAYNEGTYQADSKDTKSGGPETTYGKKDTASGDDKTTYGKKEDFTHGEQIEYTRLRHGNVGVTTNDALIREELSLLEDFNIYDWIAAKFERDNMIQLY